MFSTTAKLGWGGGGHYSGARMKQVVNISQRNEMLPIRDQYLATLPAGMPIMACPAVLRIMKVLKARGVVDVNTTALAAAVSHDCSIIHAGCLCSAIHGAIRQR
jgi:hypothetical protein